MRILFILIPYATLFNDAMRYNQLSFIPIFAYFSLWVSFKYDKKKKSSDVQNTPVKPKSLFYSNFSIIIYGMYMYSSVVQQFLIDYRGSKGVTVPQENLQREALLDFVTSTIAAVGISIVNMLVIKQLPI
jgi:hypothetical protein